MCQQLATDIRAAARGFLPPSLGGATRFSGGAIRSYIKSDRG
ncbi:hypothetical protein [Nostoc sp. DSM 114161]